MKTNLDKIFDRIIVGGGLSGIIALQRAKILYPGKKILLMENKPFLGGRHGQPFTSDVHHGYGFNRLHKQFVEFWEQTSRQQANHAFFQQLNMASVFSSLSILIGKNLKKVFFDKNFIKNTCQHLGGNTAVEDYTQYAEYFDAFSSESISSPLLIQFSKNIQKSSLQKILPMLSPLFGTLNPLHQSYSVFQKRLRALCSKKYMIANWQKMIENLFQGDLSAHVIFNIYAIKAEDREDLWVISTNKGEFKTKRLIVAQSPWQASYWLQRKYWPLPLLKVLHKVSPLSAVCLSIPINLEKKEPTDPILIPSEHTLAIFSLYSVKFYKYIGFEQSLQAPLVIKALKSLKRAARRLLFKLEISEDFSHKYHTALLPVAESFSWKKGESRYLEQLAQPRRFQTPRLSFVGDAYGHYELLEQNVIHSALEATVDLNNSVVQTCH